MNQRIPGFLFGVAAYAVFLFSFLYAIGFLGNFIVPKTIDGPREGSLLTALLVNTGLLGLFAVQHSVMARPAFKLWWTRLVPELLERSFYVFASSLALITLFLLWQPIGGYLWQFENQAIRCTIHTIYATGWLLVLVATFQINHFDLFGLRQAWTYLRAAEYRPLPFQTPGFYRYVRHPLYVGWFIVFWATPDMSAAHVFFAVMTTAYILIAVQLEERDLEQSLPEYRAYSRQVPRFIPRRRPRIRTRVAPA